LEEVFDIEFAWMDIWIHMRKSIKTSKNQSLIKQYTKQMVNSKQSLFIIISIIFALH